MKSKVSDVKKKKRPLWILRVASRGMEIKKNQPLPAAVVSKSKSIVKIAVILLFVYLTVGVFIYWLLVDQFSGTKTNRWVDALYFSFVTFCTVGYGDIVPSTAAAKIVTSALVLIGAGFLDFLLNCVVNHILDLQENAILSTGGSSAVRDRIVDAGNGRIKRRWKIPLALCGVFLCIVVGALFLHFCEQLDFVDSVYVSVVSVATVGYGDKSFKTVQGRIFAVFWLLFSTLAMTSFFLYLAETRIAPSATTMKLHKPKKSESDSDGFELIEAGKISGESVFDPFKLIEAGEIKHKAGRRRVLLRVPNCRL